MPGRAIPYSVGGANFGAWPVRAYSGAGYGGGNNALLAAMMGNDSGRDRTQMMMALLSYLQGQENAATHAGEFSQSLDYQKSRDTQLDKLARDKMDLEMTQFLTNDSLNRAMLGQQAYDRAEERRQAYMTSQASNKLLEKELGGRLDVIKDQLKTNEAARKSSETSQIATMMGMLFPQAATAAQQTLSTNKDLALAAQDVIAREAGGKATSGMSTLINNLRNAISNEQTSWSPSFSNDPREKAQAIADSARTRINSISDPVERAAAAQALIPHLKEAASAIETADWSSYFSTRGGENKARQRYSQPLYDVMGELESAAASAAGERARLGVIERVASGEADIRSQQAGTARQMWEAVTTPGADVAGTFHKIGFPSYSVPAIQDPRGSGGPHDPLMAEALEQYIMPPFFPETAGVR